MRRKLFTMKQWRLATLGWRGLARGSRYISYVSLSKFHLGNAVLQRFGGSSRRRELFKI